MKRRSVRWLALFVGLVLFGFATFPRIMQAQAIEQWVGIWAFWAFGECPIYDCLNGQHLCARVDSSSGTTWCYRP